MENNLVENIRQTRNTLSFNLWFIKEEIFYEHHTLQLRQVKKRWMTVAVVALSSLSLLTLGDSGISADTFVSLTDRKAVVSVNQEQVSPDQGHDSSAEVAV